MTIHSWRTPVNKVCSLEQCSYRESGLCKDQGDYFKKKRLWEPAMKFFQKAGTDDLEMEAKAYFMADQARGEMCHGQCLRV